MVQLSLGSKCACSPASVLTTKNHPCTEEVQPVALHSKITYRPLQHCVQSHLTCSSIFASDPIDVLFLLQCSTSGLAAVSLLRLANMRQFLAVLKTSGWVSCKMSLYQFPMAAEINSQICWLKESYMLHDSNEYYRMKIKTTVGSHPF